MKKRWKQVAVRAVISLIPVIAWQSYIGRVKASKEFEHPAYAYQRAPYQYSNVSYIENILLVDPFAPELGWLTPAGLAVRVLENLAVMPASLSRPVLGGQTIRIWLSSLEQRRGSLPWLIAESVGLVPLAPGFLMLGGMGLFLARRDWLIPIFVAASLALFCLTPWPEQFKRYLIPLWPYLILSLVRLLVASSEHTLRRWPGAWRLMGPVLLVSVVTVTLCKETISAAWTYWFHLNLVDQGAARREGTGNRSFYYGQVWVNLDEVLSWLKERAKPGEVIATQMPHWVYLKTGLKAIMIPMEINPATAQHLLDSVPVDYLILDQVDTLDIIHKYAYPLIESFPDRWSLLYTAPGGQTRIYRRLGREGAGRPHDPKCSFSVPRSECVHRRGGEECLRVARRTRGLGRLPASCCWPASHAPGARPLPGAVRPRHEYSRR